jgi:hypothetical protein
MSKIRISIILIGVATLINGLIHLGDVIAAPKPPVLPDVIDWQCRATAKIQVCELQLGDGTRCVVTDKGGVACEWRGR